MNPMQMYVIYLAFFLKRVHNKVGQQQYACPTTVFIRRHLFCQRLQAVGGRAIAAIAHGCCERYWIIAPHTHTHTHSQS